MEIVKIKPEHFRNAKGYTYHEQCPFALALNDHFNKTDCGCTLGDARIDGVWYAADDKWCQDNELFDGTIFEGMNTDDAIRFAKENLNTELPTFEVWVDYKNN